MKRGIFSNVLLYNDQFPCGVSQHIWYILCLISLSCSKHILKIKVQHSARTRVNFPIVLDVMQWIFACSLCMQISLYITFRTSSTPFRTNWRIRTFCEFHQHTCTSHWRYWRGEPRCTIPFDVGFKVSYNVSNLNSVNLLYMNCSYNFWVCPQAIDIILVKCVWTFGSSTECELV